MKTICLIGYSGHSFVVFDCFFSQGQIVSAYTDRLEKKVNPFALKYLGDENEATVMAQLSTYDYFVAVGDNELRQKISIKLQNISDPVTALHKTAIVSRNIQCGNGVMFGPRVIVNSLVEIGNGTILNSGCIVEHECKIGNYAHIAPGAVLCGKVSIGNNTLIGANATVVPGVKIGHNVIIGAGSVVLNDVPDNTKFAGNPAKKI
jgi:sugar O-acyltransferase (sialic acid O-acetyltransferase NeuD family)